LFGSLYQENDSFPNRHLLTIGQKDMIWAQMSLGKQVGLLYRSIAALKVNQVIVKEQGE
jgi:hypothetical protein